MQEIIEELNDKQKEAVLNTEGPCLVIAGAGSGKTKVLTHKIAYLIKEKNVAPWNILSITFTNKAANEMKLRVQNLVGDIAKDIWMGTFHSICVRLLRRYIDRIGFDTTFAIFDTQDQKNLIKQCLKALRIDDKIITDKSAQYEISKAKNEMLDSKAYNVKYSGDKRREQIGLIYELYQKKLKENNAIDFDDIINFTIKILTENIDIAEYYMEKFKYVLVDEYQDTNKAQFKLISIFASKYRNITVVGDNDQGIYSFRGADISNILNFEKDFLGAKIIKLEQNYRCTSNILKVANSVIKNNEVKYKKSLWTENDVGELVSIYEGNDEYEEARYLVNRINHLKIEEYYNYSDFAILYRMNTQSRAIEDILRRENIPYKVVGGLKFYERKEIKDIIAYLRLIYNQNDNIALKRIINEPKRGIGKSSLENVEKIAVEKNVSMYEIVKYADINSLSRVYLNSRQFIDEIEYLISIKDTVNISELVKQVLDKTGYKKFLKEEKTVEADNRLENLEEFLTVVIEFENEEAENTLENFLSGITLSSELDNIEETDNCVTLMTLHSAKGLEYPAVFLVGMEEGIFPGNKSLGEPQEIEEERRLCYVGITRAKNHLFMSCAKRRTMYGSTSYNIISRFVQEIPKELLNGNIEDAKKEEFKDIGYKWVYGKKSASSNSLLFNSVDSATASASIEKNVFKTADSFLKNINNQNNVDISKYEEGQRVYHKRFGEGIINKIETEGEDAKVDILFDKVGNKRLMARFAGLEIL